MVEGREAVKLASFPKIGGVVIAVRRVHRTEVQVDYSKRGTGLRVPIMELSA